MFPIPDCLHVLQVRELSRVHDKARRGRLPPIHRPARLSGALPRQGTAGRSLVGVKTVCPHMYYYAVIDLAAVAVSVDAGDAHCHRDARAQVQQTESQQKRRARVRDQSHLPSASVTSKFNICN